MHTKTAFLFASLTLVLGAAAPRSHASEPADPAQAKAPSSTRVEKAEDKARKEILKQLDTAAATVGITLVPESLVLASRDEMMVAFAGSSAVTSLDPADIAAGVMVGALAIRGGTIPDGVYLVRVDSGIDFDACPISPFPGGTDLIDTQGVPVATNLRTSFRCETATVGGGSGVLTTGLVMDDTAPELLGVGGRVSRISMCWWPPNRPFNNDWIIVDICPLFPPLF